MISAINELVEMYMHELTEYTEREMTYFLKKNLIPYSTFEQTQKYLHKNMLRLYDEIETLPNGDKKHTLLLLKIIDLQGFIIKGPTVY